MEGVLCEVVDMWRWCTVGRCRCTVEVVYCGGCTVWRV